MSAEIHFVKMHGAGNDFIMLNCTEKIPMSLDGRLIAALCSRHRGIGADGLIMLLPSDGKDFRMAYYNSDGGEADMCGNGARCAARYAYDLGIAPNPMSFETRSGNVEAEIRGEEVLVGIGEVTGIETNLRLDGIEEVIHFADSGVPHAVVLMDGIESITVENFVRFAERIRHHEHFAPKGTNVNFASVIGRREVRYRTYERGVEGETEACGTGAAAVSVITAHLGLTEQPVACATWGGDRIVVGFVLSESGAVNCTLLGPAVAAFKGSFIPDDYPANDV